MKQRLKQIFPILVPLRNWQLEIKGQWRAFRLSLKTRDEIFVEYYHSNQWGDAESRSGDGSNLKETLTIRKELPEILKTYNIRSLADIPCGDFFWMKTVPLEGIDYIGGDIVADLIRSNRTLFESKYRKFEVIDVCSDKLPVVDLIFCRDALVHLSNADIEAAVSNIKRSRATYLLTTNFPEVNVNRDIPTGMWRPINLTKEPFNFPQPVKLVSEKFTGQGRRYTDKSLALWKIDKLP
jgi:hypothetical protein